MKQANINEKQKDLLANTISNIIYHLKKHDVVDCITMFYYKKMDRTYITNTDMLRINIYIEYYDEDLLDLIDFYNSIYNTKDNKEMYGLKIRLAYGFKELDDISFKMEKDLNNSIILYDKKGDFFKLQDDVKKKADYRYVYSNTIINDLKLKNVRK